MRLTELADLLDLDIRVIRKAGAGNIYVVDFAGSVEYKNEKLSGVLHPCVASGTSVQEAMYSLMERIQGKWLVIDGWDKEKRREFGVPNLHAL